MKFLIFTKRNLKSSYFFITLISAVVILFLYNNLNLSSTNSLKVALYNGDKSENSSILIKDLLGKESIFKYYEVKSQEELLQEVELESANYGYIVDTGSSEEIFTQYSKGVMFSGISREDIYSSYFKIISREYTIKLTNLSKSAYLKSYEIEKNNSFKFNYEGYGTDKVFPIVETVSVMLFMLSLLNCYDYFLLNSKSKLFETAKGNKLKFQFLLSGLTIPLVIFLIVLVLSSNFNIVNYALYSILLYLFNAIVVDFLTEKMSLILIPIFTIFSLLAVFLLYTKNRYSLFSILSPANLYLLSYDSIIYLLAPIVILLISLILKQFLQKNS
ncbi:hypothetical protein SAMN02745245_01395 [Anaerosphaera aminiphila DSM 21120]|uniref:ABC-2 family transporter protein n=1 Tax=Anaerosphaera aminiphila DSM 21120 TaxID=1120995 RepID=A0A1M5T8V1_9FIRM|nr:hypothetical protein [Anaerosphaera aminiphila]SHH47159.1 hypothetical protein SAMN02745245_01395 [Anaerosphaera aminiphila DSM 21120]